MQKIRQGESYPIFINLMQDGYALTPDMVEDLKICIGKTYSQTYRSGGVGFDEETQQWYIIPTQEETLRMPQGSNDVCCHVKYQDGSVQVVIIDRIRVFEACCKEVF